MMKITYPLMKMMTTKMKMLSLLAFHRRKQLKLKKYFKLLPLKTKKKSQVLALTSHLKVRISFQFLTTQNQIQTKTLLVYSDNLGSIDQPIIIDTTEDDEESTNNGLLTQIKENSKVNGTYNKHSFLRKQLFTTELTSQSKTGKAVEQMKEKAMEAISSILTRSK